MSVENFRDFVRSHHPALTDEEINFAVESADDLAALVSTLQRLATMEAEAA